MAMLTVRELTFTYPQIDTPALENISFTLEEGEFLTICGPTGCGKSTLLRLLKPQLAPKGTQTGTLLLDGVPLREAASPTVVGFVSQHPEEQLVTDRVWHELAFGPENLGVPPQEIRIRVAEMASYFGITEWYDRDTASLSGGQMQLLHLASVMVMQPRLLILDEPTSQLDPIAAAEFMATLKRLNRDFSLTVILTEHRAEEAVPAAHKLMLLKEGRLSAMGAPRKVLGQMSPAEPMASAMPAAVRLYHLLPAAAPEVPLTVAEGRQYLREHFHVQDAPAPKTQSFPQTALALEKVSFRYDRQGEEILRRCSLTVGCGEWVCLLGDNGAGKSTLLQAAAGLLRIREGKITVTGKPLSAYHGGELYHHCLAMLPQNVQTLFARNTVREELEETAASLGELPFDFSPFLERHPYDLSGGQQQMAALAKVLGQHPKLLLLDEPTKGLDAAAKETLGEILRRLCAKGIGLLMVTHDVEFAAAHAHRCGLLFRGEVMGMGHPDAFFAGNYFYTTPTRRMCRGLCNYGITPHELAACCTPKTDPSQRGAEI